MIIAAGHLDVDPDDRDAFVADTLDHVRKARATDGCLDFAVAADPIDPARVNIFERWESAEALNGFRGSGPDDASAERIQGMHVRDYDVTDG